MTIRQQQLLLDYLGFSPGEADGVDGPRTEAARNRFRTCYGREPEDGALIDAVAGRLERKETGSFWDSIRWFTREEFRCRCGGLYCSGFPHEMQEAAVRIADEAREHFGRPGHVVSGLRCPQWNAHEGGVANSQHIYGEAIDLRIDGVDSRQLQSFVSSRPGYRWSYCINDTNVHFDIPPGERETP